MIKQNKEAFKIFDEWILKRGYKGNSKLSKKELWKIFTADVAQCGIANVFKCSDYNLLKKLLGLSYYDKEKDCTVDGFFICRDFKFE